MAGVVTIVQEGRFQLVDDAGVAHLFILEYATSTDPRQLVALQREQARVRVMYRSAGHLIGHAAAKLILLDR